MHTVKLHSWTLKGFQNTLVQQFLLNLKHAVKLWIVLDSCHQGDRKLFHFSIVICSKCYTNRARAKHDIILIWQRICTIKMQLCCAQVFLLSTGKNESYVRKNSMLFFLLVLSFFLSIFTMATYTAILYCIYDVLCPSFVYFVSLLSASNQAHHI